jgi:murein DD-endopeptidase MepM/ murein hydrolase activator NlpD
MGRLTEKITLMILPDQGSDLRKVQVPRWAVTLWRPILLIAIVLIAIQALGIGFLVFRLSQLHGVKADNEYLMAENAQINRIAAEFKQLMQLNYQIRRSLGANIGLAPVDSLAPDTSSLGLLEPPIPAGTVVRPTSTIRETLPHIPTWLSQGFTSRDVPTFLPVEGFVTQEFFWLDGMPWRNHPGIDIAAAEGTPILASADGLVVFSEWTYRYGNLIILYHRSGYFTLYGHVELRTCQARDWVRQGEPIGLLGNSGVSSAPHLHFEIWKGDEPVNPYDIIWGLAGNG